MVVGRGRVLAFEFDECRGSRTSRGKKVRDLRQRGGETAFPQKETELRTLREAGARSDRVLRRLSSRLGEQAKHAPGQTSGRVQESGRFVLAHRPELCRHISIRVEAKAPWDSASTTKPTELHVSSRDATDGATGYAALERRHDRCERRI